MDFTVKQMSINYDNFNDFCDEYINDMIISETIESRNIFGLNMLRMKRERINEIWNYVFLDLESHLRHYERVYREYGIK